MSKRVSGRLCEVSKILATSTRDVLAAAVRGDGATHGYRVIAVLERVRVEPTSEGEEVSEATAIMVPAPDSPEEARAILRGVFSAVLSEVDDVPGELTSYIEPAGRRGPLQ